MFYDLLENSEVPYFISKREKLPALAVTSNMGPYGEGPHLGGRHHGPELTAPILDLLSGPKRSSTRK